MTKQSRRAYVRRTTPEDKAAAKREYSRTFRLSHPDLISQLRHGYYLKHKDRITARNKAYREAHRDEINAKRRAKYRAKILEKYTIPQN